MSASRKMIYGRAAYQGFARALAAKMGLSVQVDDGASACINSAGLITIPGMNTFQTQREFEVTCGTLVHEMAHQFYNSHALIDPARPALEHDCLNALLDVADETWVGAWFNAYGNARPAELLDMGNVDAAREQHARLTDWSANAAPTHAWKVLVVGILNARGVRKLNRLKRWTVQNAYAHNVDAAACFRIIRRARLTKRQNPSPRHRRLRRGVVPKLLRLAKELAAILAPFAQQHQSGRPTRPGVAGAAQRGAARQPAGTVLAGEQDGADVSNSPANGAGKPGSGASSGGADGDAGQGTDFSVDAHALLAPAVAKVANRISTDGEGLDTVAGLTNGPRLGDAYRLATDGACLARWADNDLADGVSVVVALDCSGSMTGRLAECAGIARAFAQGMREAGPVQSLVFGDVVKESSDFERVGCMGGTNTFLAVERATEWLSTRAGQRWIVVVTDGVSCDPDRVNRACADANAKGVRILAVGLACHIVMPGATIVTAADPAHLAIELDAAAQLIERN